MRLLTHLAQGPDFCQPDRDFRYSLRFLLVVSALTVLSGADNCENITDFDQ